MHLEDGPPQPWNRRKVPGAVIDTASARSRPQSDICATSQLTEKLPFV